MTLRAGASMRVLIMVMAIAGVPAAPAVAQAPDEPAADQVVVTGTRVAGRSRLDTIAPVDTVTAEDLSRQGTTELNQALSVSVPSYNFPRPAITDGTDSVRPATLRGLAPDQTLVLVNSKRRQTSALVNVNGSIGRGSAPVDLNTIPTSAIGAVEVLRDGASAQYGSDAIAGVINVRLREASSGGNVTVTYGERRSTVSTNPQTPAQARAGADPAPTFTISPDDIEYKARDGATITTSAWVGLPFFGEDGFLTLSGEWRDAERTVRVAADARRQYPLVAGAYDPREATANRLNSLFGDPKVEQFTFFANAGKDFGSAEFYGWASYQDRDALSSGFFRRPAQTTQNVASIYPDGFVPLINALVTDASLGGGLRFDAAGFDWDASIVWGSNEFEFVIRNTLNASLGAASPTVFEAGSLQSEQIVANIGAVNQYEIGLASPLNVAFGIEAREEGFQQRPGELASYTDFDGPAGNAGGAQVFSGFQPSNRADEDRNAVGVYLDLEANLTERLLVSGAVRGESYSDFGESITGKVAGRYDFTDGFALRGAASTGFRAPSLQQSFFSSVATNLTAAGLVEVGTFRVTSPVAIALGAQDLEAEKSKNASVGAVFRAGDFSLTVDGYFIQIDDRIVLTENLTGALVTGALTGVGITNVSSARFFVNGVDTETMGVDVVARWSLEAGSAGDFDFTVSGNLSDTEIKRLPAPFAGTLPLFDVQNQVNYQHATPDRKLAGVVDWEKGAFGLNLKGTYFGPITDPGLAQNGTQQFDLGDEVLFDAEARATIANVLTFAVGAENVFDEYGDTTPPAFNATGALGFSRFSPFGFNGRYVYARAALNW